MKNFAPPTHSLTHNIHSVTRVHGIPKSILQLYFTYIIYKTSNNKYESSQSHIVIYAHICIALSLSAPLPLSFCHCLSLHLWITQKLKRFRSNLAARSHHTSQPSWKISGKKIEEEDYFRECVVVVYPKVSQLLSK